MSLNLPRRQSDFLQERIVMQATTVAAISATTIIPLATMDTDYVVDKFEIEDPNGYTSDSTNYYDISLQVKKRTYTAVAATDLCTLTAHGYLTGDAVQVSTSSAVPGGLAISTTYYVIFVSANTFKLATTPTNAAAGTAIDITSTGTGTQSISKVLAMYSLVASTGNGDLVALTLASATIMPNPTGLAGEQVNAVLTKIASGANVSAGARLIAHAHLL